MGQVNVKISDDTEKRLDIVAAAMGMQRPDFLRSLYDHAIRAHETGGVAFSQSDSQRVDLKASELLREVKELLVENERSRRENLKLSERLLKASNGGEEAVLIAQERLTEKIVAQRKAADFPFRQEIEFIKADIEALPDAIGDQVEAQLQPMDARLAIIEASAREPRFTRNLVIGREFVNEWSVMATMSGLWLLAGMAALLIAGNFIPSVGRSLANQFVDSDVAICEQLNDRFAREDCALPDLQRRNALIAMKLEQQP
jgi:hypothetical protein